MKLIQQDLDRALKILPEEVKALLIAKGKAVVVAGGYIRSVILRERIKDIDIFGASAKEAEIEAYAMYLSGKQREYFSSVNAYTIKNVGGKTVQFIHRWVYDDPEKLIASFDFTIAKAAFWYDKDSGSWESVVDERFYPDCAAKRIVFTNPDRKEEPAGSLLRVLKFSRRGYIIPSDSLAGVVNKLVKGVREENESFYTGRVSPEVDYHAIYGCIKKVTGES